MSASGRTWREAAGALTFAVALFGPLVAPSPVLAQPTIQRVAVGSDTWLGITTDSDTLVTNPRHKGAPVMASMASVSLPRIATARSQALRRSSTTPVRPAVRRKVPEPSESCPDAH